MAPLSTFQEKRVKLLEIFDETKDFFQLKDLEKMAPKMKGIASQSVKGVLRSLIEEGLVQMDRIGSSNFFWNFPPRRYAIMHSRLVAVKERHVATHVQFSKLETEKASKPENEPDRLRALEPFSAMELEHAKLERELAAYESCDPMKVEEQRRILLRAQAASARWHDNYILVLSCFTRKYGVEASDMRAYLEVDEYDSEDYESDSESEHIAL